MTYQVQIAFTVEANSPDHAQVIIAEALKGKGVVQKEAMRGDGWSVAYQDIGVIDFQD